MYASCFFFFKQKTAYEIMPSLVGSEMCIRDSTGAGEKAFCTGGDVKQRAETGDYGPSESGMFEIGYLHKLIRDIPKPVIAGVNGVAATDGHVLHVLCDVSIASE